MKEVDIRDVIKAIGRIDKIKTDIGRVIKAFNGIPAIRIPLNTAFDIMDDVENQLKKMLENKRYIFQEGRK